MSISRLLTALLLGANIATPATTRSQSTPPSAGAQRVNFWADDDRIIEWLAANGRRVAGKYIVVWAPADSMTATQQPALVDTLDRGLAELRWLIGAPLAWQRIADRPVQYYLGPRRLRLARERSRLRVHFGRPRAHRARALATFRGNRWQSSSAMGATKHVLDVRRKGGAYRLSLQRHQGSPTEAARAPAPAGPPLEPAIRRTT